MVEICRNFQRGSCKYGDRCRYLHSQQQPRKANVHGFGGHNGSHQQQNTNPFGFGSAAVSQQQDKGNSFRFGQQNSPQLNGKPNQLKPFDNKWSRQTSGVSRQPDNNSKPVDHQCTDPENCKRQIAEDFKQEKPLWILTCYSHCKGGPCDIVGDISFEELRASAYEDAKSGMSFQSIVEKERNILNSKLVEFQKLLSEPYKMATNFSLDSQNHQSIGANASPFSRSSQNNGPLSVSSFSQLGTSLNMGFERPSAPLTNTLSQPSFFGSGGNSLAFNAANPNSSGAFGAQSNPNSSGVFGAQSNPNSSGVFGAQSNPNSSGVFGAQSNPNSSGVFGAQSNPYSTPVELTMFPGPTLPTSNAFKNSGPTTMFQTTPDVPLSNKAQVDNVSGDFSIWLKEKWNPGEIPEEAPPDAVVR